jgi:IclR family acetate operon transcriptional repressor
MGTITKALVLLNKFSSSQPEIGLSEFKLLSNQDKATVYRHLSELEENGFLEQNPLTKNYRLGPAVLRLAAVRERTFPAREAVSTWVDALSRQLGELVHVSLFQGDAMSPLYHADIQIHGTRVHFDEAELLPLHATSSGLAMLAFGPDDLLPKVLARPLRDYSGMTITDPDALQAAVVQTRKDGFALSNQGFEKEVYSIAMPIFGKDLEMVGTLSVALPITRLNDETRKNIISGLKSGSVNVSDALGGAMPDELIKVWNNAA